MKKIKQILSFIVFASLSVAQTTGKISGVVKDADTNEPLIATNIIVQVQLLARNRLRWFLLHNQYKARHLHSFS